VEQEIASFHFFIFVFDFFKDSKSGKPFIVMKAALQTLLMLLVVACDAWRLHTTARLCKAAAAAVTAAGGVILCNFDRADAFDNALANSYTMPKQRGPQPTNLGVGKAGLLRACLKPSPNCFSTTADNLGADEASTLWGEDVHSIPRWRYKSGDPNEAFGIISKTIDEYVPGQGGIDGGGFLVVKRDASQRYLYAQFESLKRGYLDDVEVKVDDDATVQIVSSSRLGYLDFQVNAKRLNFLSEALRRQGFEASEITAKSHPVYFESNVR